MIKFPPVRHTAALVAFACRKGEIELAHPHHPDSADFTWTPHTLVCFAGFCPPVVFLCQCVACIGADHAIAIVQRKNFVTWVARGGSFEPTRWECAALSPSSVVRMWSWERGLTEPDIGETRFVGSLLKLAAAASTERRWRPTRRRLHSSPEGRSPYVTPSPSLIE